MQRGSQAEARRAAGLPVLPREVMYRIVHALSHPASEGDAASVQALLRLSAVCHIVRDWALSALYDVLVLPRHVRDFRKWYARMRAAQPPFPSIGYVRALFVGIDDITRLTQTSAGWESELLRFLHYHGSTIEYLSLWQTESRALLRDAAQVSGQHSHAAWAVGEHLFDEAPAAAPEPSSSHWEDQDMPQWLRDELAHAPTDQVARQHMAHFPLVPRAAPQPLAWRQRPRPRLCTPRCLSIVMHYPFYENERPDLFAKMIVWSCVEELDVYVPMELDKSLQLLSTLIHTPTRRLRISSAHTTLAIESLASAPWSNACDVLAHLLRHATLHEALLQEMRGRGVSAPEVLRAACLRHLAQMPAAAADIPPPTIPGLRLCFTSPHQAVWGKLRHRLWDFRERAQYGEEGAWAELLRSPT